MDDTLGRRLAGSAVAIVIGLAALAGLWLLPDLTPADAIPAVGQESLHSRITAALEPDASGLARFQVEVLDGPEAGEVIDASVQGAGAALPGSDDRVAYQVGDEVVVARFTGPAGGAAFIAEPWRVPMLGMVAAAFAAVVLVVGGLRGARSLVALALTLAVVIKLVVPLLLRGVDPVILAVGGGALVTLATLLMTEGVSRVSLAALLGTMAALGPANRAGVPTNAWLPTPP